MPVRADARKAAFDFNLVETAVKRAGLRRLPGPHGTVLAKDEPNLAVALRHGRVGCGGHGFAVWMRMIVAQDLGSACACGLVRTQQCRGIDLEATPRIGRDIGGGQD